MLAASLASFARLAPSSASVSPCTDLLPPELWAICASVSPPGSGAGIVYGVITVGALMAAESGRHESYVDAIASAVFATLLYWLAHAYADLLGSRLDTGEHLTVRTLGRALAHDWAIVRGGA